jgi:putative sterol carrier protein
MTDQLNADQVTPDQLFEQIPQYFQPDKAGNTNATINFDLGGPSGGKYWVKIADAKATAGKGEGENPNLTLLADANDFVKIIFGQLDPTAAFMQGKLKIKGDMGLALKFQSMFKRPS